MRAAALLKLMRRLHLSNRTTLNQVTISMRREFGGFVSKPDRYIVESLVVSGSSSCAVKDTNRTVTRGQQTRSLRRQSRSLHWRLPATITIDGNFSDWVASERIDYGDVAGYSLYSEAQNGFLYFDLNAPAGVAVGPTTTIWLNTDLNAATGYNVFGFGGGAKYNVEINADGTASLYQDSAGQTAPTLVLSNISIAYSADKTQVELAIPLTSIGNPSNPIDVTYDVNNSTFGPISYTNQPYVAPNADVTRTPTHKVAIVYSDTTAANYFRGLGDAAGAPSTAYDDLFMAAQNQARMAGVSYDIIDESQLTNVNNLIGYDALIFPSMTDVNTAQLPAIMSALTSAVYDYHIPIITSGDFLTNDQTGAPLAGNPYVNMETLLGLNRCRRRQQRQCVGHRQRPHQPGHEELHRGAGHPDLHRCRLHRLRAGGQHAEGCSGQPERH